MNYCFLPNIVILDSSLGLYYPASGPHPCHRGVEEESRFPQNLSRLEITQERTSGQSLSPPSEVGEGDPLLVVAMGG